MPSEVDNQGILFNASVQQRKKYLRSGTLSRWSKCQIKFVLVSSRKGWFFWEEIQRWQKKSEPKVTQSNLTRLYPSKKPDDAEDGGWDGVFDINLTLYCGIRFNSNEDNKLGDLFLRSKQSMIKLEDLKVTGTLQFKQLKLVYSMI